MFSTCPRPPLALLALVLSLSFAAAARAQGSQQTSDNPCHGQPPVRERQNTSGGGAGQQQQAPPAQPLTGGQKVKCAFRGAFLSPVPYLTSIISGGIRQIGEDRLPHKDGGDEVADWGSQSARIFATRATTRVFTNGFYAAAFRQDPRYERSTSKGVGRRALHAMSRVFVTRGDDGDLEPNYSRFAGSLTSAALANVWEHSTPGHDRVGPDATLRRFTRSFATGALSNIVFREFLPDIIGIFRR
ncbi:MAG TPA: hypothetical protein VJ866_17105 [Pyrinomonadaceae bacterium]|nr:hypothetical protein [Pyrinomonadaceae bacterium]